MLPLYIFAFQYVYLYIVYVKLIRREALAANVLYHKPSVTRK